MSAPKYSYPSEGKMLCNYCLSSQNLSPSEILFNRILLAGIQTLILCFLVTLIVYLIYKYKKHEHSLKDTISKCWPRWIIIFILLVSVPIITFLLYKF